MICVVLGHIVRVLIPDPADQARPIGVREHRQNLLQILIGPGSGLAGLNVSLLKLLVAALGVPDECLKVLESLS